MASKEADISYIKRLIATKYLANNKKITDHILNIATANGKKGLEQSSETLGQMLASPKLFEMLERAGFADDLKAIDLRVESLISKQTKEDKEEAAWQVMYKLNANYAKVDRDRKDTIDPVALKTIGVSMKASDTSSGGLSHENMTARSYHELYTAKSFSLLLEKYRQDNRPSLAKRVAQFFSKTPKMETPKVETPKAEAPKAEAPKAETPKAEAPKAEAPKVETPKAEAPKAETPKAEAPKVESPNASKEADIAYAKRLLAIRYLANHKNITDHIFNSASFGGRFELDQASKALGQILSSPKLFEMLENAGFGAELKAIDEKVENQIEKQLNAIGKGGWGELNNLAKKNEGVNSYVQEHMPRQLAEKEQAAWRAIKALNVNHSKHINSINDNNNPAIQDLVKSVSASMRAGDNLRDGVSKENANDLKFHEIFAATSFASKLAKYHQENKPSLAKRVAQFFSKTPKMETPKVEAPKVETPKAEAPKVETPKVETPKAEAPKVETPKVETPKAEEPKVETPKAEAPKAESPKVIEGNFGRSDVKIEEEVLIENEHDDDIGFNFGTVEAANDEKSEPEAQKLESFDFGKIEAANNVLFDNIDKPEEQVTKNSNIVKFKPK